MLLASALVLYLFLIAGLSREHVNAILTILRRILQLFVEDHLLCGDGVPISGLPVDVRTLMRSLDLDPVIHRSVCCGRCFKLYPLAMCPSICSHQPTSRSQECGTPLLKKGKIPYRYYNTQSLEAFLDNFLSRPSVQSELEHARCTAVKRDGLRDVQDSERWHDFTGLYLLHSYYVIFS